MSKPSILLIPGSFALPEFYDEIVNGVAAKGYEIRALHLPSVATHTGPTTAPPRSMYDDASLIATEASKLISQGKDVILVAHSYGGTPATEAVKGLEKSDGKRNGVVMLAYMTCLIPAVGASAASVLQDVPEENKIAMKIDEQGWMYQSPISHSAKITFSDLPAAEGEAWIQRFPRHLAISFGSELTYAGYKDVPVSYLLCEEDMCIPEKNQREGIELMERVSGRKVDVTGLKAGHVPVASQPERVIEWIVGVAEKAEKVEKA